MTRRYRIDQAARRVGVVGRVQTHEQTALEPTRTSDASAIRRLLTARRALASRSRSALELEASNITWRMSVVKNQTIAAGKNLLQFSGI
jgi:hypothetical protein